MFGDTPGSQAIGLDLEWPACIADNTLRTRHKTVSTSSPAKVPIPLPRPTLAPTKAGRISQTFGAIPRQHHRITAHPQSRHGQSCRCIPISAHLLRSGPPSTVELSRFHHMVNRQGARDNSWTTTKVVSLQIRVRTHFGLSLDNDHVRAWTSDWSTKMLIVNCASMRQMTPTQGRSVASSRGLQIISCTARPPSQLFH